MGEAPSPPLEERAGITIMIKIMITMTEILLLQAPPTALSSAHERSKDSFPIGRCGAGGVIDRCRLLAIS
jgi:hypothetical protein